MAAVAADAPKAPVSKASQPAVAVTPATASKTAAKSPAKLPAGKAPLAAAASSSSTNGPAAVTASPKTGPTPSEHEPPADLESAKKPEPVPTSWTDADLAVAQARCNAILKSIDAVAIPEAPFRSGSCGAPAPMRLISIGKNPEVSLSPPPILSCDMLASLATWLKNDLQPLARKHMGQPIIRIDVMSDYSCRAAYGRKGNRLSEHGRANALDIRGFVGAKGQQAIVLAEWGKTERDIRREIALAKAAAEKAEKERAAAAAIAAGATAPPVTAEAPSAPAPVLKSSTHPVGEFAKSALDAVRDLASRTIVDGMPMPGADDAASTTRTLTAPLRLGGPKDAAGEPGTAPALPLPVSSRLGRFLREAHASACRIFGTTLGPEANEAHRNHFHIDMAERKSGKYCE